MRKITKFGIGIMVVIVVLVGLWMYYIHGLYEKSYNSEYHYRVTIETNSVLHDVTLYLPLPVFGGESKIGDAIIAGDYVIMGGKLSKPDDWDCSIVETEYGKMLKINAEKMAPEFHSFPVPIEPGEEPKELPKGNVSDAYSEEAPVAMPIEVIAGVSADHDINTKNPIGNEPLLSPRYNLTRSTCDTPYPEGRTPPNCYEYESRIYVDHTTSPDAVVSIYIESGGENSWWIYGWSGNQYIDQIEVTFTGEQHGWHITSGKLVEGEGRYGWM